MTRIIHIILRTVFVFSQMSGGRMRRWMGQVMEGIGRSGRHHRGEWRLGRVCKRWTRRERGLIAVGWII